MLALALSATLERADPADEFRRVQDVAMPRFNGLIVYPFEVLTQLLWCYLLFGAFYLFLFGAAISLFGGDLSGFMVLPMVSASTPSAPALVLQFVTMSAFRICFWPRFPYVPGFLTFTLAMLFATTISTIALAIERLFRSRNSSVDAVLQWATDHADELGGGRSSPLLCRSSVG